MTTQDKPITGLTELAVPPDPSDYFEVVDTSDTTMGSGGTNKKIKYSNVAREILVANRDYYVRTDGSDSNNGLTNTAGGAFLTIQKAVNVVCALNNNGYAVTIHVGAGTYTGSTTLRSYVGSGHPTITGDTTTPSNVLISTTSSECFTTDRFCGWWNISGFKLQTTTGGQCILAYPGSFVVVGGKMEFGACAGNHMWAYGGLIQCAATYTISGGALVHINSTNGGYVYGSGSTVTLSGTPGFVIFASCDLAGRIENSGSSWTGAATGTRYSATLNSVIQTGGGGATYFPGNVGGTTATGGQYA